MRLQSIGQESLTVTTGSAPQFTVYGNKNDKEYDRMIFFMCEMFELFKRLEKEGSIQASGQTEMVFFGE